MTDIIIILSQPYLDSLVRYCGDSSVLAMELPQLCTKPLNNNLNMNVSPVGSCHNMVEFSKNSQKSSQILPLNVNYGVQ